MRLAANLSRELLDLLGAGRVRVDAVKITTQPGTDRRDAEIALAGTTGLPIIMHFWGQPPCVGTPAMMDRLDLPDLARAIEATGATQLQSHLAVAMVDAPEVASPDRQTAAERKLLLDRITANVREVMAWSGLPLLVENSVHWGTTVRPARPGCLRCVVEPEFIGQVVGETGCGFLLDIAHARITAHYLGLPFDEYLERLPRHAIGEVHINRPAWVDGVFRDRHLGIDSDDLTYLRRVLAGATPSTITYEYGTLDPAEAWRSVPESLEKGLKMLAALPW